MSKILPPPESAPVPIEEWDDETRALIENEYGGEVEANIVFAVFYRKHRDMEASGYEWDGWPFTSLGCTMFKVDDPHPMHEKVTWFVFKKD